MPARAGVFIMHPMIMWQVSFRASLTSLLCLAWLQLEQAYSAVERHSAKAIAQTVGCSPPKFELTSLHKTLLGIGVLKVGFKRECLVKCYT